MPVYHTIQDWSVFELMLGEIWFATTKTIFSFILPITFSPEMEQSNLDQKYKREDQLFYKTLYSTKYDQRQCMFNAHVTFYCSSKYMQV